MGLSNLPLASGSEHAKAFQRLGWTLDRKRRGRGKHLLLTKDSERATLSIPDHHEVKRTIIAALIALAGVTEENYLRAFNGTYEPPSAQTATAPELSRPAPTRGGRPARAKRCR
jgi:hypothetical protein